MDPSSIPPLSSPKTFFIAGVLPRPGAERGMEGAGSGEAERVTAGLKSL